MKDEDIARLSKGIKLKKDLASISAQIENIKEVNIIKLFKTQTWNNSHKQINFDIPLNNEHPYSDKARLFLESYIEFLEERQIEIQQEFDLL